MRNVEEIQPNVKALIQAGTPVVDVRTPQEFLEGHDPVSQNLPLQDIATWSTNFKADEQVILVCRSGGRAGSAQKTLQAHGVKAYNLGAWQNLAQYQ